METGVGLLEEVMALLQDLVKLNTSAAVNLSRDSEGPEHYNIIIR